MTIQTWLPPALLALAIFGTNVFISKITLSRISPRHLIVWRTVFFLIWSVVLAGVHGFDLDFARSDILLAMTVGVVDTLATLLFFTALKQGPVAPVVVISSLYPVMSTILAVVLLHEALSGRQALGIAFSIGALVLAAQEDKV